MTTKQIKAEQKNTGAAEDFIPLFGFSSEGVFLTVAGDLGVVLKMQGAEYECLDLVDLDARTRRFEAALRAFGPEYRIYQYVMKTHGADVPCRDSYPSPVVDLAVRERIAQLSSGSSIEAYLVVLYSKFRKALKQTWTERLKDTFLNKWSASVLGSSLSEDIVHAPQEVFSKAKTLCEQMEEQSPMRVLARDEAFRFFRRLLNPDYSIADSMRHRPGGDLARQVWSTDIAVHRSQCLRVGTSHVHVLTLKTPPPETHANLLRSIVESESQCVIVTEWHPEPPDSIRKVIKSKTDHVLVFANVELWKGIGMALAGRDQKEDPEPSKSQRDSAGILQQALSALDNEGVGFGSFSLTLVVRDTEESRLAASVTKLYKSFAELDIEVYPETLGQLRQYFSIIPGNDRFNRRYQYLSVRNYADLSLLFLPQRGQERNEQLNDEYLVALSTRQRTPYLVNLHWGDSPHAIVVGVNGSGKTFAVNNFATHAQKYDPYTLILDIGGSYRNITEQFGGSYLEMNPGRMGVTINPFCLPPDEENLQFVQSLLCLLIESGEYTMTDEDKRDMYDRIQAVYDWEPAHRTLSSLYIGTPPHLKPHLDRWVRRDMYGRCGQYGTIFDNVADTLTLARFQTCDFTGLDDHPEIAEPLLYYVLHRSRANVYNPATADVYKLTIADECWRFLDTDITRTYLINALKTWRKHNAAMWMITQQPEDLKAAGVERIMAEAQTAILLANPRMDEATYRHCFKLNDTEIQEVRRLQPKRELLIKQPAMSKILRLDATEVERSLYSSTPQQRLRLEERKRIA